MDETERRSPAAGWTSSRNRMSHATPFAMGLADGSLASAKLARATSRDGDETPMADSAQAAAKGTASTAATTIREAGDLRFCIRLMCSVLGLRLQADLCRRRFCGSLPW
jgi:hypothetical protein